MITLVEIGLMATINAIVDTIIVLVILSRRTERMMGVTKVRNPDGEIIYAPLDPDGNAVKVPVARTGKDGKVSVSEEYAGLAYSLPVIAAMNVKAAFYGKVGKQKQQMEADMLAGMDIDTAAKVQAFKLAAQGKVGQAFMALLTPIIAQKLNASGNAGQQNAGLGGQNYGLK